METENGSKLRFVTLCDSFTFSHVCARAHTRIRPEWERCHKLSQTPENGRLTGLTLHTIGQLNG